MKMHTFLAGVAVGSGLMLLAATSSFSAQDPPEMTPEMMEMMEASLKYTTPSEEHAALALASGLRDRFGSKAEVPRRGQSFELGQSR